MIVNLENCFGYLFSLNNLYNYAYTYVSYNDILTYIYNLNKSAL